MIRAIKRRGRGRPRVGSTQINVRFPPGELKALNDWIKGQRSPPRLSKPQAIRRLVETAIYLPVLRLEDRGYGEEFDMTFDGQDVGRIYKPGAAPQARPWLWTIAGFCRRGSGPHYGHEPTQESALKAFRAAWAASNAAAPAKC